MPDVAPEILDHVRAICTSLPEVDEQAAWIGVRWQVRKRTFAHVLTVDEESTTVLREAFGLQGEVTAVVFRAPADEVMALRHGGYPFAFAGWGRDAIAMHLTAHTDWTELRELLTDSYCTRAPAKLVARVTRPFDVDR